MFKNNFYDHLGEFYRLTFPDGENSENLRNLLLAIFSRLYDRDKKFDGKVLNENIKIESIVDLKKKIDSNDVEFKILTRRQGQSYQDYY